MKWYRIAHRDGEIEEQQFPSLAKALEYTVHHDASLYAWDCGWRKVN